MPQLPNPDEPRIHTWVPALAKAVGTPDDQTYFVGHSMGCQTIARYLETLPEAKMVGGAVFVAGFFKLLTNLEDSDQDIASEWLTTPIDFLKIRQHLRQSIALFSDNDPWVPLDNQDDFRNKLGSEIIIEHNMGHFNAGAGITELPEVRDAVLKIAR